MADPLIEQLASHKAIFGRPLKIGLINYGGTILCVPSEENPDLLEPLKSEQEIASIILQNARLSAAAEQELIQLRLLYHNPMDSSQMLDFDREQCLHELHAAYLHFDGFIILHGTDTGAMTARLLHLNLPYFNPALYWNENKTSFNWTKPVVLVSSQEPAVELRDGKLVPMTGSDGDLNLVTALRIIIDDKIGEAGVLTNGKDALRGCASQKGTESGFPQYICDPGISVLADRTAFGMNYNDAYFLPTVPQNKAKVPFVITDSAKFQGVVLLVSESNHLALCKAYLKAKKEASHVAEILSVDLPRVILYQSKGAGNVQREDYSVLKQMQEEGVYICKVPLPGGRVPIAMHYNVPGGDIPGYNIEGSTARYKAQAILALMEEFRIPAEHRLSFFHHMMNFHFGNEFLPTR
jgi:L-asparaginase/Glu-tRNA(Gln) amidotransferase subunit D